MKRPLVWVFLAMIAGIWLLYPLVKKNISYEQENVHVTATVKEIEKKGYRLGNLKFLHKSEKILPRKNLMLYTEQPELKPGYQIEVKGDLKDFSIGMNPGEWDAKKYYASQGVEGFLSTDDVKILSRRLDVVEWWCYQIRHRTLQNLSKVMETRDAGTLGAMLLGDKTLLDTEVKDIYKNAGIGHILAISGLHISLLGAAFFWWLRTYVLPMKKAVLVTILFLAVYGKITGFPVATSRAVWMMSIMLMGRYLGKRYDGMSALSFAGILTLWMYPEELFQCGFLLSYVSAFSLYLFRPVLEDFIPKKGKEDRANYFESLLVGIFLYGMTLPVLAYFYFSVSRYAIVANFLLLPCLSLLLGVGILGSISSFFLEKLAGFLLATDHYLFRLMEWVCTFLGNLPGDQWIMGRPALWKIFLYYLNVGLFLYVYHQKKDKRWCFLLWINLAMALFLFPNRVDFCYSQLYVGQGDCSVILEKDHTYVIDCGSTSKKDVGNYVLAPYLKYYGRNSVDAVFLSHSDEDHVNGFLELAENPDMGIEIGQVFVSGQEGEEPALEKICQRMNQCNIPVKKLVEGDLIKTKDSTFTCYHPDREYESETPNDLSLSILFQHGDFKVFFVGDLEAEGEENILEENLPSLHVDVLKVGHHGSKTSSTPAFLSWVDPKMAVISAGKNNRYGHPARVTLQNLEAQGIPYYSLMETGALEYFQKEGWYAYLRFPDP